MSEITLTLNLLQWNCWNNIVYHIIRLHMIVKPCHSVQPTQISWTTSSIVHCVRFLMCIFVIIYCLYVIK